MPLVPATPQAPTAVDGTVVAPIEPQSAAIAYTVPLIVLSAAWVSVYLELVPVTDMFLHWPDSSTSDHKACWTEIYAHV